MSASVLPWRFKSPPLVNYGIAVLSAIAAVAGGLVYDYFLAVGPSVSLFLCAIMFAAWAAGTGPALLATAVTVLAFEWFFLQPDHSFIPQIQNLPRLGLFVVTALFVVALSAAQRRAEVSLRRARDEQASMVQELQRLNEKLRHENAERKRAESALQRSETYLAEAQKLSLTGSFGWVIESGDIFWSEQTYDIMGLDRTAKPSIDLIMQRSHPDDRALVQNRIEGVLQGAQNLDFEHRLLMPGGQVRHLHVRAHRVRFLSGQEEMVGALMDITEARRAQEALDAAQANLAHASRVATLGEISASIAHEVNQPLAAIVSNGEACLRFLGREAPDLNDVRGTVEWIVKDGNRAGDVIRRVRAFLNKAGTQMAPLHANEVINEVVALLQRELVAQRVSLRLELAPDLPVVVADRIQLQQVIVNLVMNGIEAMQSIKDRRRELVIGSHEDDPCHVVIAVTDRGVGIAGESVDKLFNAFFSTKPDGLGMGLSICRSIIEAHRGRIWASANDGPGATLQFALPSGRGSAQ